MASAVGVARVRAPLDLGTKSSKCFQCGEPDSGSRATRKLLGSGRCWPYVAFWEIESRFLRLTGRQGLCPNGPPGEKIPSFVRVSDNPAGELWRSPKQRAGGVGTAALTPMTAVDPIFRERRLAGRIRSATRPASKLPETRKHVACHRFYRFLVTGFSETRSLSPDSVTGFYVETPRMPMRRKQRTCVEPWFMTNAKPAARQICPRADVSRLPRSPHGDLERAMRM